MENNEQETTIIPSSPIPKKNRKKIILGVVILFIAISGFLIFKSIQSKRLDQKRLNDIAILKGTVEKYHKDYKFLPVSIASFSHIYTTNDPKDPETKKDYIYEIISPTEYKFCTKFSSNSDDILKKVKKDKKTGLGCIIYKVTANTGNSNPNLFLNEVAPSRPAFRK